MMIVSGRGQIVGCGVLLCIVWGTSAFLWTTSTPAFLARTVGQPQSAITAPHSETISSANGNSIQSHPPGVGFLSGVHSTTASPFMSALYARRSSSPPPPLEEDDDEDELEEDDDDDDDDDENSDFNMDDLDEDDLDDDDIDEDMESFLDDDEDDEDDYEEVDDDGDDDEDLEEDDLMEVLKELTDSDEDDNGDDNDDDDDDSDAASEPDVDARSTKSAQRAKPLPAKTGKAADAASGDKKEDETQTIAVSSADMPTGKVQWKHLSTYDSSILTAPPTTAGAGAGTGAEQYDGDVPSLVANAPALNTTRISSRGDIFGDVQAFWARIGISYRNMTHEKEAFLQERKAAYHDRLKRQREKYRRGLNDTGSPEYQVAGLTERINYLAAHLVENPKDFAAERGLVALVNKRRRHLNYLYKEDIVRYESLISSLSIRHRPPGAQRFDRALKYATFPPQNPRKLQKIKNKKKKKKQKGKR